MFAYLYIIDVVCYGHRTNHTDDHVVDKGPIPDERIKLVRGEVVFEEEHTRVRFAESESYNTVNSS